MTLLQIAELNSQLYDYGVLGVVVVLMMGAIVYLQTQINKKDAQILGLSTKSIEAFNSMSVLVNSISETSKNIPEEVRVKLLENFRELEKAIESCKK